MTDIFQTLAQELADAHSRIDSDNAAFESQIAMQHELREQYEADRDEARDVLREGLEERDELREIVSDAWAALGHHEAEPDGSLADAITDALPDEEERASLTDAGDALRAYLVSIGLPSDPVTFDSPELRALADLLL